jgi:chromosomal replication initiation ATPase DnaA
MAQQLPLDLPHRPALDRADFLVTPANELAVAWIDRWPDWPGPALVLHGPAGSGKTHLTRVWQRRADAVALEGAALAHMPPPRLLGGHRTAVVEDVGRRLAEAADPSAVARGLLHLHNLIAEAGGSLLLTDTAPPRAWPMPLPDLGSRLGAAPAVALGAPDDALLAAVMVKLFQDRQLAVTPEVVTYLLARIERSFAAVRAVVGEIDRAALAKRQGVTVPLAREVLQARGDDGVTPSESR